MRLHHLALGARDVERVATFYASLFGLTELRRHHYESGLLRSIWLQVGELVLMVEETSEPARHVPGVGAGPFLLAFAITDADRPTFLTRLNEAGGTVESTTTYTTYFRDPEGNRVAVSSYPV